MKTSETIDALSKALAAAQGEMENATLNRVNPHFRSKYADLAAIRDAVIPALSKNGLSVTQATGFDEAGNLRLYTRLTHESGQWIESVFPLKANDNPQAMGSQLTYARRYTLSAISGISADEDDDAEIATRENGKPPSDELVTKEQVEALQTAIVEIGADLPKFLEYLKVKTLSELPATDYKRALAALNAKRQRAKEAA